MYDPTTDNNSIGVKDVLNSKMGRWCKLHERSKPLTFKTRNTADGGSSVNWEKISGVAGTTNTGYVKSHILPADGTLYNNGTYVGEFVYTYYIYFKGRNNS